MTRERLPAGPVLQRAYGVLDKYQISRTFFIKTDQNNCDAKPEAQEAYDPTETSVPVKPVTETKKKIINKKQQSRDTIEKLKNTGNETVVDVITN